jgi:hypothetical protein
MFMSGRISNLPFMLMTAAVLVMLSAARADDSTREYRVKAALIFNFMQFVEWPQGTFAAADSPFIVAVVGQDPFDGTLDKAMADKTIGGRKIVVKYFGSVDSIESCQLLFVPAGQDPSIEKIIKNKLADQPILTIGESEAFMWAGGIARFYYDDGKIHFEIDPQAADQARLKFSSKLLKMATIFNR